MKEMISNAKKAMSNAYFLVIADDKKLSDSLVAKYIHHQSPGNFTEINIIKEFEALTA